MTGRFVAVTHNLCVFRQYFPIFPFASLNTLLVHPGVAQIPDILDLYRGRRQVLALRRFGRSELCTPFVIIWQRTVCRFSEHSGCQGDAVLRAEDVRTIESFM